MNSNWRHSLEMLNLGQHWWFLVLSDLEIWQMTLQIYRTPLFLYYIKLCAWFQSHQWIKTGVTARKRSFPVKIDDFLSRGTLKIDRWPCKTTGHLSWPISSFLHYFIAIGKFKLELQYRNAQFGSKSAIFCAVWPWNLTEDLEKW